MTNDRKKDHADDNVVSIAKAQPEAKSEPKPIASPEDFLQQASSLVNFENQFRDSVSEPAKPAARISGLGQLASRKSAVKLPQANTEEHSDVTPFPQDRGKPPSSRTE